jgi:hypothetical protein
MSKAPPTGADLWERYFLVKINYLKSRPTDQIRRYGVRVSGNPDVDRYLPDQEITTQMNIDAMFEKYRMGVNVRVVNYNDTAEIYRIIHHHLIAWAEYLNTGINIGNAPLKDLVELDVFAGVVYDKARSVFSEEVRETAISKNFANVQSINFQNILQRESKGNRLRSGAEVSTVNKLPGERPSMKDIFVKEIDRLSHFRESGE